MLEALRQWSADTVDASLPAHSELHRIEILITRHLPLRSHHAQRLRAIATEWLTHGFAAHEDLEGCVRVNQSLYQDENIWLESRFTATERALDLALFIQDHAEARRLVERLKRFDIKLASPHFAARYLHAKAKQLGALDPSRGVWESEEATRLEQRFGLIPPI